MQDVQLSPNFRKSEFRDTHFPDADFTMDPRLIAALQALRDKVGVPIHITSGYRTPETNKRVGGVPDSQHCLGKAADITADIRIAELFVFVNSIPEFKGIGLDIKRRFVHVDVRDGERVVWRY